MSSNNRLITGERAKIVEFQAVPLFAAKSGAEEIRAGESKSNGHGSRDLNEIEREAFQKGFKAGENTGLKMAERKIDVALKRFAQSLEELGSLRKQVLRRCERDLVELSIEIARKLVHREVKIDETIIVTLVRVALERTNGNSKAVVFVNPLDFEVLERCLAKDSQDSEELGIMLKVRNDLARGDFLIESDYGQVDARISEQFKEIESALLSNL